ncbi:MAG: HK97 family phage prohead protease [Leifsonia sp.]
MEVTHKDATITATPDPVNGNGTFEAILSSPTKDRDGDTLLPDEWKMPLPAKITVDIDHDMSVRGTIGSAVPRIDEDGNLRITGTFASTPLAQEVRTLMVEGHIDKTSVAFMSEPATTKDGRKIRMRELLNAAIVAIPSNREAAILEVRAVKTGARNSAADAKQIQSIHDTTAALGADCVAAAKAFAVGVKDADTEDATDPVALIQACDAAIDEAIDLFASVDVTTLPAEVQQAIALVQAADTAIDELMDAAGIPDPDEDAEPATTVEVPAAADGKSSPAAATKTVAAVDADSDAVTDIELRARAMQMVTAQYL